MYWFAPIVADAEAGFGGPLNTFELIKAMIEAGAAAVHLEDHKNLPTLPGLPLPQVRRRVSASA